MEFFGIWIIFSFIGSIIAASIASTKGRSGCGFFLLSFLITPILSIIIALIISPIEQSQSLPTSTADEIKCSYCAELIKKEAKICRFCGREVIQEKIPKDLIQVKCENCLTNYKVENPKKIKKYRCKKCQSVIIVKHKRSKSESWNRTRWILFWMFIVASILFVIIYTLFYE